MVGGKLGRLGRLFALFFALVLVGTACGGDDTTGAPDRHLSVAEAREETRENPDDPDAWKALASALSERGQTNAAIPAAQRLLSLRPKSTDAYRRLAVLYMAQGRAYQQDSQPAKARASFKRAVATYRNLVTVVPKNKYARIELGQAAEQAGDPATAIAAYTAYLRLTPNDPNAKYVRQWLKRLSRS